MDFDDADLNALCKSCSRPRSSPVSQRCRWLRSPSAQWPQQTRLARSRRQNKEWPLAPAVVSTLPPLITKVRGGTGKKTRTQTPASVFASNNNLLRYQPSRETNDCKQGEGSKSKGHVPRISYVTEPSPVCVFQWMPFYFCFVFLMCRWLSFSFVPRCLLVCLFTKILSNEMLFSHQPQNQKQHRSRRLRGNKNESTVVCDEKKSWVIFFLIYFFFLSPLESLRAEACVMRRHRESRNALHPANCWHLARIKALMQLKC